MIPRCSRLARGPRERGEGFRPPRLGEEPKPRSPGDDDVAQGREARGSDVRGGLEPDANGDERRDRRRPVPDLATRKGREATAGPRRGNRSPGRTGHRVIRQRMTFERTHARESADGDPSSSAEQGLEADAPGDAPAEARSWQRPRAEASADPPALPPRGAGRGRLHRVVSGGAVEANGREAAAPRDRRTAAGERSLKGGSGGREAIARRGEARRRSPAGRPRRATGSSPR